MTRDRTATDQPAPNNLAVESGEAGTYLYEPSGIRERSGYIPIWLKLVSFGLILWGLYYAIRYWSSY